MVYKNIQFQSKKKNINEIEEDTKYKSNEIFIYEKNNKIEKRKIIDNLNPIKISQININSNIMLNNQSKIKNNEIFIDVEIIIKV